MPLRRKHHSRVVNHKRPIEHTGFYPHLVRYLEWIEVHGYAQATINRKDSCLRRFITWCDERALNEPNEITKPILESYQRYLYHYRKSDGKPMAFSSQKVVLASI